MRFDNGVVIIGTGITAFGSVDRTLGSLASEAVRTALADAGVTAGEVGMVFFASALAGITTGQEAIGGQIALKPTGLLGKPIVNVQNACASGTSAAHLAMLAIKAGVCDVTLAVGAEGLTHPRHGAPFSPVESLAGGALSYRMDTYAEQARAYMWDTGATFEDFARVVVKSRRFGSVNPHAQFRAPITEEEVLAARAISGPLTLPMCSRIGDGAAALVLSSRDFGLKRGCEAVGVRTAVLSSGNGTQPRAPERVARLAVAEAAIDPLDLDVVELYDASAHAELMAYEEIGLCAPGDGPKLLRTGDTDHGGAVVVNPSGGLLSRGHPVGATGCAQLVELSEQLRGRAGVRQVDGARLALAHNTGGHVDGDAVAATATILERLSRRSA